uniref:Uncharacterized protein n=1 Tax=Panagrolaimus sp. PS1159 TaxID=55785 RepID=A0AC35F8E6_9BILA
MNFFNGMSQEEIKNAFSQYARSLPPEEQAQWATSIMPSSQQHYPNCGSILDQLSDAIKEYLKEHQKEALEFLYKRIIEPPNGFYNTDGGKGAIIAHNMGLGKTTTTVAFLHGILNEPAIKKLNFKILIVSPVNVIQHWMDEFNKEIWDGYFKDKVCELHAPISAKKEDPHDTRRMHLGDWHKGVKDKSILILGYEICDKMLLEDQDGRTLELLKSYLQNPGPDIVIFDEGHRLKNDKTRKMIVPGFLGEEEVYNKDYGCKIERGKFADASERDKKIARETEEKLYEKLKEIMNRKDAEYLSKLIDVNKKEITITSHPLIVEAKERKHKHQRNVAGCREKLKDLNRSNQMRALFNIIEACNKNDEKLVVYTQSIPILDFIEHMVIETFRWKKGVNFFRIDGKINATQRALHVNEFNNERNKKARLFLFSIRAGSVGINLISANRMVLFDHCFNPVHNTQATYRIYRIGQKRDVFIYRFITKNSSGDCVLRRQIAKEQQSKRLIDGRKNIASKYSKKDIETKRGHENYNLEELENEFNDELLIEVVEKMKDGVIEISDHDEHFEETLETSGFEDSE